MYEDTKKLVGLVEDAAAIIEKKGTAAFPIFAVKGSKWFKNEDYLFVYNIDGVCLFHPLNPELVGKNIINMEDINGEYPIKHITNVGKKPEKDAGGWVFYHWEEGAQLDPNWKASYIRKVITPDNRILLVGSGTSRIKIEKLFIKNNVDLAVDYLKDNGREKAFAEFRKRDSVFNFFDVYIIVFDTSGHALVDPAYPTISGRDMMGFKDAVGRNVIAEVMSEMKVKDEKWVSFLWPKRGEILPSRKLAYCRKVHVSGETFVVFSDFFLATPIWMRG